MKLRPTTFSSVIRPFVAAQQPGFDVSVFSAHNESACVHGRGRYYWLLVLFPAVYQDPILPHPVETKGFPFFF